MSNLQVISPSTADDTVNSPSPPTSALNKIAPASKFNANGRKVPLKDEEDYLAIDSMCALSHHPKFVKKQ